VTRGGPKPASESWYATGTVTIERAAEATDDLERLAAHALTALPDSATRPLRIGLGSGRAASAFIRALGARVGAGLRACGVATSEASAALAREVGIPVADLDELPLDLTVDGADEVDPALDLIKGYGGALVRERIVAAASRRQVILVTADKLVARLGARGRLPVEVLPFGSPLCERRLAALGCPARLRESGGRPFVSDNGNLILDCAIQPPTDPVALEAAIRRIPGVVDTGFFLGTAELVLVAEAGRVRTLTRVTPAASRRSE
jgi:ribose 5-phosphate isomerase A